jgi:hypothetical protein
MHRRGERKRVKRLCGRVGESEKFGGKRVGEGRRLAQGPAYGAGEAEIGWPRGKKPGGTDSHRGGIDAWGDRSRKRGREKGGREQH